MKHIILFVACLSTGLVVAGCGSKDDSAESVPSTATKSTMPPPAGVKSTAPTGQAAL